MAKSISNEFKESLFDEKKLLLGEEGDVSEVNFKIKIVYVDLVIHCLKGLFKLTNLMKVAFSTNDNY